MSPQEDREPSTGSLEELLLPDRERSAKVQCVRFSDTQWTTKATTGEMYKFTFKKKTNKQGKEKKKGKDWQERFGCTVGSRTLDLPREKSGSEPIGSSFVDRLVNKRLKKIK